MMKLLLLSLFFFHAQTGHSMGMGEIEVFEDLTYKRLLSKRVLPAGTYSGKMNILKNKIKLKIADHTGKNHRIKVKFKINSLPSRSGSFSIEAKQLKQPFSIRGNVLRTAEDTIPRRHYQSCSISVPVRSCSIDRYGRTFCRTHYQYVYGQRLVETITTIEHFNLNLSFNTEDQRATLATFKGQDSQSRTRTNYLSPCYI